MTTWIMEPRDPLLVRDGRPFGSNPGARATSLPFPFPSTIAGGFRSRNGVDEEGTFRFTSEDKAELQRLKNIRIRGPLLVQLAADSGDISPDQWLLPAPHDALFLSVQKENEVAERFEQLVPLTFPPEAGTDLDQRGLWFVGLQDANEQAKPRQEVPAYWYWESFKTWLSNPDFLVNQLNQQKLSLCKLGLHHLTRDQRTHVSIEASSATAKDGMLFETSGLEFTARGPDKSLLRLALAITAEEEIREGLAGFGGERRLVAWRKSAAQFPACPEGLAEDIADKGACRIILLTPACFQQGYRPTWLQAEAASHGVQIEVKAIAVKRPLVVSGWDLAERQPKPSRRLAPAGTVLFLSLNGEKEAIRQWISRTWMFCISDNDEDRADGFGLAVPGIWSGQPVSIERSNS